MAAKRGDGMGISHLLAAGFKAVIISTETNPVVAARAKIEAALFPWGWR